MTEPRDARRTDRLMTRGLLVLMVFAPLAFGGVEPWARGGIQILAGLMASVWLIERATRAGSLSGFPAADRWLVIPAALVVLLVVVQQVPLPARALGPLSPAAARLYARTVPGWSEGRSAEPSELPAWTVAQVAGRMPAASDGVALPAVATIPDDVFRAARPWRTLSIEPYATRNEMILLLSCVMAFIAAARMGRDVGSLMTLARCAALTAAAVSVLGIVQWLTWNGRIYWVREGTYKNVFGPFVNRNSYAALAALVLPVALCLAAAGARRWRAGAGGRPSGAIVWGGCALAIASGIVLSGSRGGLLAAVTSAIALAVLQRPATGTWRRVLLLIVPAMVIAMAGLAWGGAFSGGFEGRLAPRLDVWRRTLALVGDYPLLGSGLGTFRYAFLEHAPPGRGWWMNAHNEYLEMVSDLGLLGGGLIVLAFAGWARMVARRGAGDAEQPRALRAGILAGLAALMLHAAGNADLRVPAIALFAAAFAGAVASPVAAPQPARAGARRRVAPVLALAALLIAGLSAAGGVSRIAAFRSRYLASEVLPRTALDEAWGHLATAAWWQPSDPDTWRQMSTVARNALGFGVVFRGADGFHQEDRLGVGLGTTARALALNPAYASAWMDLASLYEAQELARTKYERMRAGRDLDGEAASDAPPARGLAPEDRVAIAAVLTAIDLQPELYLPHEFLARLYWRRGLTQDAATAIRRSFALMPRPSAHEALLEEGFSETLADAILEGIEQAPIGPFITEVARLRAKGEMLERLARYPEALSAWRALKEAGGRAVAAECEVRMARIDQSQGRFEESLAGLRRAALDSDARWSAEALYFIGRALSQKAEHREALDSFSQYLERRPDVAAAWQAVGKEMEATGDPRRAEETYRAGLERLPNDSGLVKLLVALLERQGRGAEAAEISARYGRSARPEGR